MLEHVLVPKHEVLGEEEVKKLLEKYGITKDELPKILKDDAALGSLDVLFIWDDVPGDDSGQFLKFLKDDLKQEWVENAESEYLFSLNDVSAPGKDNEELLQFLKNNLKQGWVENAEIKKSDEGKTLTITNKSNSVIFKLNGEKNRGTLELDRVAIYEYILKEEGGKINIYSQEIKKGKKCNDGKIMTLLNRNNYILFKLNLEKNMVDIDVGHENKYKYILKEERGKINILNVKIGDVIKITRKSPTTRESFYYREVIES